MSTLLNDDMVVIPGGEFTMGLSAEEAQALAERYSVHPDYFGWQTPQRRVNVETFAIDRFEVTNAQYRAFVKDASWRPPIHWRNGEYPSGQGEYPVTGAHWYDAMAYANWVGKRLPTEVEWEKAARGTDGRLWPWGNEWLPGACNCDESSLGLGLEPAPVGSYPEDVSPYGVYDMAGNVTEWTAERNRAMCGVRGGAYVYAEPYNMLCAKRQVQPAANGTAPGAYLGFRCAKSLSPDAALGLDVPLAPSSPPRNVVKAPLPAIDEAAYRSNPILLLPIEQSAPGFGWGVALIPRRPAGPIPPEKRVPCHVEFRVPYLPGDQFALFFEGAWFQSDRPAAWDVDCMEYSADFQSATFRWDGQRGLRLQAELRSRPDAIEIVYQVSNRGSEPLTGTVGVCFALMRSPNIRDHDGSRTLVLTEDGLLPITRVGRRVYDRMLLQRYPLAEGQAGARRPWPSAPLIMVRSRPDGWVVGLASSEAVEVFNNLEYSCLHSTPGYSLQPGEQRSFRQMYYFLRGSPEDLVTRWRRDFMR